MSSGAFIDLDRQFVLRDPSLGSEELAGDSVVAGMSRWRGQSDGWDALLSIKSRSAVVLGEPGSGRTFEFLHQVDRLRADGKNAFYLLLSDLAGSTVEIPLNSEQREDFAKWTSSSESAFFFLDAADEAKLESVAAFKRALQNFARFVGAARLKYCRIFISCRVHQWEPLADETRVLSVFGFRAVESSGSDECGDKGLPVYVMLPLDQERIRRYANAKHIDDAQAFLDAIQRYHCWDFAGRPYDVEFLLGYWKSKGKLDSLDQMIDQYVSHQLEERRKRHKRVRISTTGLKYAEEILHRIERKKNVSSVKGR